MLRLKKKIESPTLELPVGTVHTRNDWEKILGISVSKFVFIDDWFEQPIVEVEKQSDCYLVKVRKDMDIINFSGVFTTALYEIVSETNSALKNCPEA